MSAHARLSPSSFSRRRACPGSLALEEQVLIHTTSEFSDEGTAAHQVLEWTLGSEAKYAHAFEGRVLPIINGVYWDGTGEKPEKLKGQRVDIERTFTADEEMCGYVQQVVDRVVETVEGYKLAGATNVTLQAEQRVDASEVLGVPEQFGTVDITVIAEFPDGRIDLSIEDLKFGRGVKVDADDNEQLMVYAASVALKYEMLGTIRNVRMVIHQPRLSHHSVAEMAYRDLMAFVDEAKQVAETTIYLADHAGEIDLTTHLNPTEDGCKFCDAKATCPALAQKVLGTIADELIDLDAPVGDIKAKLQTGIERVKNAEPAHLAALYPLIDLIADFPKAVLARIEGELLAGRKVEGVKLVAGKKGHRKWTDDSAAEAAFKSMRLKQEEMYDFKLISPTTAEKRLKDTPKRWSRVKALITQSEGKPSVAPLSDNRPPLVVGRVEDDLETVPEELV